MNYDERRKKNLLTQGICPACRKNPTEGKSVCETCRLKAVNKRLAKQEANPAVCLNCGKLVPRVPHQPGRPNQACSNECRLAITAGRERRHKKYGITQEQLQTLREQQDNKCAICRLPEGFEDDRHKVLSIDHDHQTQQVRGLLCHRCNVGLGMFRNSPEHLEQAIEYLKAA